MVKVRGMFVTRREIYINKGGWAKDRGMKVAEVAAVAE